MTDLFFHEAEVARLSHSSGRFNLDLEKVATKEGVATVRIMIEKVFSIKIDRDEVESLVAEPGDGEILSLEFLENGVSFVVEWERYSPRVSITHSYSIRGGNLEVAVDRVGNFGAAH